MATPLKLAVPEKGVSKREEGGVIYSTIEKTKYNQIVLEWNKYLKILGFCYGDQADDNNI